MKLECWLVNADNYRGDAVADELRSMAAHKPHVIAVVEATGNPTPALPGMVRIADNSSASRRNIVAYVRADLNPTHVRWTDMRHGWKRPENPGWHEPRSILRFRIGGRTRIIVAHGPDPRALPLRAKREHLRRLAALANLNPLWPVLVLWDSNGAAKDLARLTRTRLVGWRVDLANARRIQDAVCRYLESWPRVDARTNMRFGGDHRHVWRASITIADRWCRTTLKEKP